MSKKMKTGLLILVIVSGGSIVCASQPDLEGHSPSFSFVSYLNVGGGEAFIQDESPVLIDVSYGLHIAPWLSLGAFIAVNPLSDFEHADLEVGIADRPAAFALMSGMEVLCSFSNDTLIHPMMRLALGGVTVGNLEDIDGEEGYDVASSIRASFASISAGLELNLTNSMRLVLRGGWRFANHGKTMGIEKHGLGGPEISVSLRTVWKTEIGKHHGVDN